MRNVLVSTFLVVFLAGSMAFAQKEDWLPVTEINSSGQTLSFGVYILSKSFTHRNLKSH